MKKIAILLIVICTSLVSLHAQKWLWARGQNGTADPYGGDHPVASDNHGNAYETGVFLSSVVYGSTTLTSVSDDMFLVKYDSNGNVQWAVQSNSVGTVSFGGVDGCSVSTDSARNVYVAGTFLDSVYFDKTLLYSGNGDIFIAKYTSLGKLIWVKQSHSSITSPGIGIFSTFLSATTDVSGNTYITSTFIDSITFGSLVLTETSATGNAFIVMCDSSGNVKWGHNFNTSGNPNTSGSNSAGESVALDNNGGVYWTGSFIDTVTLGANTLRSPGTDCFLARYTVNGNLVWLKTASVPSSSSSAVPVSIGADGLGNIYMAGNLTDTAYFNGYTLKSAKSSIFLVKFDTLGNVLWAKNGGSYNPYYQGTWSVTSGVKTLGGGYLIMYCSPSVNGEEFVFGNDSLALKEVNPFDIDEIMMEFDPNGKILCNSAFDEGSEDDGTFISADPTGRYIYTGGDLFDTIVLAGDTLPGSLDNGFITRWVPCIYPTVDTIGSGPIIKPKEDTTCPVYVPTAFSPNGDHHNDIEYVYGNCISGLDFIIYDRWGNKVFESTTVKYGWDGTYKGQAMNTGAFAYYLTAVMPDGTVVKKKGSIALVR